VEENDGQSAEERKISRSATARPEWASNGKILGEMYFCEKITLLTTSQSFTRATWPVVTSI
jgi:hypothetical protein